MKIYALFYDTAFGSDLVSLHLREKRAKKKAQKEAWKYHQRVDPLDWNEAGKGSVATCVDVRTDLRITRMVVK